jgi:hypothetical protein
MWLRTAVEAARVVREHELAKANWNGSRRVMAQLDNREVFDATVSRLESEFWTLNMALVEMTERVAKLEAFKTQFD